jgi:hypothetical protein
MFSTDGIVVNLKTSLAVGELTIEPGRVDCAVAHRIM